MAISSNSPDKTTTDQQTQPQSAPDTPNPSNSDLPNSSAIPATVVPVNPNPNLNNSQPITLQPTVIPPPTQIQSFVPPSQASTVVPPTFRPSVPLPTAPQFSPIPNASYQNHGIHGQGQVQVQIQPPGVMMPPPQSGGVMSPSPQLLLQQYGQPPGQQPMRMYSPMQNGYQMAVPPQGTMNPPGIIRYAPPYPQSMLRPAYPQRPLGAVGVVPASLPRPPLMAMRGPVIIRPPVIPVIPPTEKPMTMVYVGKIASTVDNDFMLSLLQLCGPVKSWKRVQDTGGFKGFGFCEFESPEGVLRALRMLNKLSIDGQELMLNFDKATGEYLNKYVEKKKENFKNQKATDTEGEEKETSKEEEKKENDNNEGNNNNDNGTFGLVSNEDKEADKEANEKIKGMIEERIKNKPLPPPPSSPPKTAAPEIPGNSTSEHPARSKEADSDADVKMEDRNSEEMTSKGKLSGEPERAETSSPERNNKSDRRSKDRERDLKREKERELERYEREREQERAKREREREYKIREEERRYRARLKEWEVREKEKERARKQEREREKDKEQDRKYEIIDQENDEGYNSKKRKYRSSGEEREERKRRLREKEEDNEDRIKEEEEIAEAKRKEEEERELQKEKQKHALEILSSNNNSNNNGGESNAMLIDGNLLEIRNRSVHQSIDTEMEHVNATDNRMIQNGTSDDSETRQNNNNVTTKKLGFGLVGSGKRTTVPSLFHEEEDEDAQKDKKMRPLVPIDYTTEELQAVHQETTANNNNNPVSTPLVAAAEFAKRIGNVSSKEDRNDSSERDRGGRRAHGGHRDRDRDETRKETAEKSKTPENKKLLDAKQLIDTIPKTKDELFSYPINWVVYDKNGLHERMRPWISKKITEFLGEEETTLVDYIVSSTQEHVNANEMLDRLQSILDDEAEMFVLKMWRMLIFEIKKLESGLAARSKS